MEEGMYGNAWEKFPIQPGDLFEVEGGHRYICAPFGVKALDYLLGNKKVELIYTDPPWDIRIANNFRKWAGLDSLPKGGFDNLLEGIAVMCGKYSAKYVAIEMGMGTVGLLKMKLKKYGATQLDVFFPTYGNGITYCLWVGTFSNNIKAPLWNDNPNGKNSEKDRYIPRFLARNLRPASVLDMFVGVGSFLPPFIENGAVCYGLEFNKRKLANLSAYFNSLGKQIKKVNYLNG